jgi:flagellar biogenesis protein FliO
MMRFVGLFLVLAFAVVRVSAGAEADSKREARAAANSNLVEDPRPQLAANTNAGPEVPMVAETPRPASWSEPRVAEAASGAAQRRKTGWMLLAVLAVVAASYLLQRLRSRSDSS